MTNAISTTGLTKRYRRVTALADLTLDVPAGTVFGFLGPNGAGKTTAMKILAGLARATGGSAAINGVPVTPAGLHRRELGYLAQDPRFYDWMTGRETLEHVARFHGPGARTSGRIAELLDRVGVADAADRPTREYSGGMRQRLGIAAALVGRPAVILLDEPVSALDPIGRRDVLTLMQQLRGETTVFYSTHILDDVERVADHVAILDGGRLVAAAPTRDLLGRFSRGRLTVVLRGASRAIEHGLAALPEVAAARLAGRDDDVWTYDVTARADRTPDAQRAITRFAADADLTLISNAAETLDLESVFLRLVDHKEVAA
jgi:ABC-2 type transport system ATP-binding protein